MISKLQLTSLLAAFAVVALLAATASATVHPLSGNARFQIGDGLPIPIDFNAPPNGGIPAVAGAVVSQPAGPDPRDLVLGPAQLVRVPVAFNLPVWGSNNKVYEVNTTLGITIPLSTETLAAGGRTGAATVSFCAGQTVTPSGNPACTGPNGGPLPGIRGLLIYTATGNQFGGAMGGRIFGGADVALNPFGAPPPFAGALMVMALASPNSTGTGGIGNAFGGVSTSVGNVVTPGVFLISGTSAGAITNVSTTPNSNPGPTNAASGAGGPWTTGVVKISVTNALGPAEIFTITGSDNRVSGVGSISLVAGSVSNRTVSGPQANRGWLNLSIGAPLGALPSMSGPGIAALVGLMSLAGGYAMRQRNRK
jgi:hypothetical protein